MCKSGDLSGLRYGSVVMRERVGAIEANIQLGHATDANFVFLRKRVRSKVDYCKILQPSLHRHGNTTSQDSLSFNLLSLSSFSRGLIV